MNTAVVKVRRLVSQNKAIAAGVTSLTGALGFAVASWIGSGEFDLTEIRLAGGALGLAIITYGGTWAVSAGDAEVAVDPAASQRVA